ncbi:ABC transporter substrate-binding protein [Phreatobacter stygius]|uniref:ABC transporter substrate-binding protein n=1 Tax=Phreatobacter stygius TaxID=1940610 RepID=A0A4D7B4W6_9HYPH|nr:ABC transporter substrate-binding protein [Phreatobacter stygius]QCI65120.1 ABC transporter substrate-binding protein [Phreatobacter stygius]
MRRWLAAPLALLALTSAAAAAPSRVVSFNLCADQLVLALADPSQIAALSPYARHVGISAAAEAARAFPVTSGSAEEALALGADLVFLGPRDRLATGQLLGGRGIRVERMPLATSLDDAKAIIRSTAAILGHPERGEALAARLDAATAPPGPAPSALPYERRGYAAGPTTMLGDALARAGFRHARPAAGFGGFVSLEAIVLLRPDVLVLNGPPARAADQGTALLAHPVLARLYPPDRRIVIPDVLTVCPGPGLVEAITRLAAARAAAMR